jgi:hypothetical protein
VQCGLEGPISPLGEQHLLFLAGGEEEGQYAGLRERLFPRILRGWEEKFPLIQRF